LLFYGDIQLTNPFTGLIFPALFTVGFIVFYSSAKDKERRLTSRAEEAEKEIKTTKETLNEAKQTVRQKDAQLEHYKTNLRTEFDTQSASIAKNLRVKENLLKQEITNVLDKVDNMTYTPAQEKTANTTSESK
jgi:DNA anti-recombination protein RmuC